MPPRPTIDQAELVILGQMVLKAEAVEQRLLHHHPLAHHPPARNNALFELHKPPSNFTMHPSDTYALQPEVSQAQLPAFVSSSTSVSRRADRHCYRYLRSLKYDCYK